MGLRGPDWPFRWISLFLLVSFMALVVGALVWAWRGRTSGQPPPTGRGRSDDALAALRMRYARGELTREEFVQANQDLGGPPLSTP
jgi:uncharacterized membrane protein